MTNINLSDRTRQARSLSCWIFKSCDPDSRNIYDLAERGREFVEVRSVASGARVPAWRSQPDPGINTLQCFV